MHAGDDFVLTMAPQTIDFQYTTANVIAAVDCLETGSSCGSFQPGPDPEPDPDPDPEPDPAPGACAASGWAAGAVYTGGETVAYQGAEYRARWWTQGNVPGAEQ